MKLNYYMMPAFMSTYDLMGILSINRRKAQAICRDILSKGPYYAAFKLGRDWKIDPEGFEAWNGDCFLGRRY